MARTLAWAIPPKRQPSVEKLGNPDIGVLEINKYGTLFVKESISFRKIEQQRVTEYMMLFKWLEVIAKHHDITVDELQEKLNDGDQELLSKYGDEYVKRMQLQASEEDHMNQMATAMIQHRVDPDWQLEDTEGLPQLLITEINEFIARERQYEKVSDQILEEVVTKVGRKSRKRPLNEVATIEETTEADASKDSE